MKKYRMLIASVIALVVIAAAYCAIVFFIPEEAVTPGEAAPKYTLVECLSTDLDRIDITHADGYEYAIVGQTVSNNAGGTTRNYVIEGKSRYEFNRGEIGSAVMAMINIVVDSIIDEAPASLTTYGFDEPACIMTVTPNKDAGEPVTIILGDTTPVGSGHYAMIDGKPEVYVLSNHVTRYMLARDTKYRNLAITEYTDVTTEIRGCTVTENGKTVLGVRVKTKEEFEAANDPYAPSSRITAPVNMDANDTVVVNNVFSQLAAISAISVVEDGTANAEKYGLTDNTTVVVIENTNGTSKKFTLSQPDNSGYRYGIVAGIDSILLFNDADFNFTKIDYKTLLYKGLWIHNIEDVKRVEMDIAGEKHTLDFTFTEDTASEVKEGEEAKLILSGKLDGKEISESNARLLYGKVLSPMAYDFSEGMTQGKREYKFKIIYNDGRAFTMDFARLNDRQYAAIKDGNDTGFYVNVNDLTAIGTAIEKIENGHELSVSE